MEYIQPEPLEMPIECDCFDEPFTIGKKVLVVDDERRTSRHAGAMALGMIMGMAEAYPYLPLGYGGVRTSKPRKEHKPHSGSKEQERRLRQLAKRKDT